jgi:hypothetical protein
VSERSALQTDREKITPIASDSVKPLLPVKAKPMGFYALLYALNVLFYALLRACDDASCSMGMPTGMRSL